MLYKILDILKTKGGKIWELRYCLKKLERKNGYSLEQLARLTGISRSHLNYIEKNEKEPSLSMAVRIAQALNVRIEELYKVIP